MVDLQGRASRDELAVTLLFKNGVIIVSELPVRDPSTSDRDSGESEGGLFYLYHRICDNNFEVIIEKKDQPGLVLSFYHLHFQILFFH